MLRKNKHFSVKSEDFRTQKILLCYLKPSRIDKNVLDGMTYIPEQGEEIFVMLNVTVDLCTIIK